MLEQKKGFQITSFHLKIIAILAMLVDHIGIVFYPENMIFRTVGRLAFPIFAFLLVEGFCHTKNIWKYLQNIFILALMSEVPFDLIFYGKFLEFSHQNIFFTLFLALAGLSFYERFWYSSARWGSLIAILCISELLHTDYSYTGILMVFLFYLFRERALWRNISIAFMNIAAIGSIQSWAVLALIPLAFYKGEQGRRMKLFFYAFYPVHLLLLFMIRVLI